MKFFWGSNSKEQELETQNNIDYSNLSDEELLDSFKSDSWSELDEDHRVAVVQEMENRNAVAQGREPATVVSMDDARYYGQYNSTNNQLSIDVTNVSSYETLDTYVHETNHAYQDFAIKNGSEQYDEHTLNMMKAEMARDQNGALYNYARTSPEYDIQCDELDSNNKAAAYLLAERDRYGDDPEYRAYIQERAEHFENVNSTLENDPDTRVALQQQQAEIAWIRGDISNEEYNSLSSNISNPEFQDETVSQSYDIGDAVISLNKEYEMEASSERSETEDYMGSLDNSTAEESNANDYVGSIETASSSESDNYGEDNSIGMD